MIFYFLLTNISIINNKNNLSTQFNIPIKFLKNHHNINFLLPKFFIRIGLITVSNFLIIKILLWTTVYENILLSILNLLNVNHIVFKKTVITSLFACQFLEIIPIYIKNIIIAKKLRSKEHIILFNNQLFIKYMVNNFIKHIKYQVTKISSVLYIRQINIEEIKMTKFDDIFIL